jgi:hypothetical protein
MKQLMKRLAAIVALLAARVPAAGVELNDYPTAVRAEYVFACMKANGETPDVLRRCACSIDVIAALLPYDRYVTAETVASLNQAAGQIGTMMRSTAQAQAALTDLRRAQAEAEIRCF